MDNSEKNLVTLEELTDMLIPPGTPERKLQEMVMKLGNMLDRLKFIDTSEDKVIYLEKQIRKLIREL